MAAAGGITAQPALLATSPLTQPLAQSEASGFPKRILVMAATASMAEAAASVAFATIKHRAAGFGVGEEDGSGAIEADPTQPDQKASQDHQHGVVTGDRHGHALRGIFAAAGA